MAQVVEVVGAVVVVVGSLQPPKKPGEVQVVVDLVVDSTVDVIVVVNVIGGSVGSLQP